MTPHKHATLIKAWADGAEIEVRRDPEDQWRAISHPAWNPEYEYRSKPSPKTIRIRLATFGSDPSPAAYTEPQWHYIEQLQTFRRWLTPPIPITYEEPSE